MDRNFSTRLLVSCGVKTPAEINYTYDDEAIAEKERYNGFWKDYTDICKKYGLELYSEDSACGLEIVDKGKTSMPISFDDTEPPCGWWLSQEYKLAEERSREWSNERWDEECIKVFGEVVDFDIWGYLESDVMPPEGLGSPALRKMIKEYQEKRDQK